jgi:outer membrane lipoprotein SlyB
MMKNSLLLFLLLITTGLAGCASNLSGDTYSRSEARTAQQVEYGTIVQLRPVQIEGTKTPIGAGAGAIVGGVAGSGVGGGKGSTIMAVIGAVAGGMAGAAVEEGVTRSQGVEITVKLASGRSVAVVQGLSPHEKFAVGDQVRVISHGGTSRVSQ